MPAMMCTAAMLWGGTASCTLLPLYDPSPLKVARVVEGQAVAVAALLQQGHRRDTTAISSMHVDMKECMGQSSATGAMVVLTGWSLRPRRTLHERAP